MSWLRCFSTLPTKISSTVPIAQKEEWEEIYFTPEELTKAKEALQSNKKVWLVPVKHYNSQQFVDVFKMLEGYTGDKSRVRLNIPWAYPGSWCGCNTSCEEHEEIVIKEYAVTRQLV